MTDVFDRTEWYYSITIRTDDGGAPAHIRGVTDQGMCTTRKRLINRIVDAHTPWGNVRSIIVHHLERNDLAAREPMRVVKAPEATEPVDPVTGLTPTETDRLVRASGLFSELNELLEERGSAFRWDTSPRRV